MIRDITIGQYYPAESVLHRLDPRVKLLGTVVYVITVFFIHNPLSLLAATLFLAVITGMSKIPVKFIFKGLKAIYMILFLTVIFSLFLTPGEILWQFWIFKVTQEGIRIAFYTTIRLTYLIMGSSLMTLTTTPTRLTDGMETGLRCLNRVHVPVHEVAMMMSIALRFIPILVEESDKIMKAQQARGADFESGSIITRVKNLVPLIVPLFIAAIRRANDLAMAMEARCYHGGKGRTKMKPLKYGRQDAAGYGVLVIYILVIAAANIAWGYVRI